MPAAAATEPAISVNDEVCCDKCEMWRVLPAGRKASAQAKFFCEDIGAECSEARCDVCHEWRSVDCAEWAARATRETFVCSEIDMQCRAKVPRLRLKVSKGRAGIVGPRAVAAEAAAEAAPVPSAPADAAARAHNESVAARESRASRARTPAGAPAAAAARPRGDGVRAPRAPVAPAKATAGKLEGEFVWEGMGYDAADVADNHAMSDVRLSVAAAGAATTRGDEAMAGGGEDIQLAPPISAPPPISVAPHTLNGFIKHASYLLDSAELPCDVSTARSVRAHDVGCAEPKPSLAHMVDAVIGVLDRCDVRAYDEKILTAAETERKSLHSSFHDVLMVCWSRGAVVGLA